ncbi:MAG TPA: pilus assembly protein TadG-related protein [Actinomycetota bacterium]|nr:pilus assembly protein TadG-related protein [Actinomycetota bacterium]
MRRADERGQVTVLVLGMALIVFAVAGVAVDGTRAWLLRRSLQNAADAAALAGAGEIDRAAYYASGGSIVRLDPAASEAVAARWLEQRGLDARASIASSAERVAVEMRTELDTTFLALIGVQRLEVAAEADAAPAPETP